MRQVNIGVGTCGAKIVEGKQENESGAYSSHAVSADGSRVFFEAVPGNDCTAPAHVYERVNGTETLDLGTYRFVAANPEGSQVLLEKANGEDPGLYLSEKGALARFLVSSGLAVGANMIVSEDLDAVYIDDSGNVSRYDIPAQTLSFVIYADQARFAARVSGDGRYYYFDSRSVPGVPGGAVVPGEGEEFDHGFLAAGPTRQAYRYDSVEHTIECVSCASPFSPEPKLLANAVSGSSNGDFVFFQTPAALVPADVDGEVVPEGLSGLGLEHPENENSVSGDVYEWRRDGLDGCSHLQGCLALITNGRGGDLNLLLGSAEDGHDVFIYTSSQLVGEDNDTAGDIYDVRIDGGFAEPSRGVECEGDACSTPFSPPTDVTPSTATFRGAGNVAAAQPKGGKPKAKPKPKCKAKNKKRCKASPKRRASRKTKHGVSRNKRAGSVEK